MNYRAIHKKIPHLPIRELQHLPHARAQHRQQPRHESPHRLPRHLSLRLLPLPLSSKARAVAGRSRPDPMLVRLIALSAEQRVGEG